MYLYYQTAEDSKQPWQMSDARQDQALRNSSAYHISIYHLDKDPDAVDPSEIRYHGDLWVDIDHKPSSEDPTQEETDQALMQSIYDLRRLLSYLDSVGLPPQYCKLFATGKKGFHICVPCRLFGAELKYKNLPKIHKRMAQVISERAGLTGLDRQLYAAGKGKLLRVENKQRSNGKYKVPINYAEVTLLTPEHYSRLTSAPRVENREVAPEGFLCKELVTLFEEAKEDFARVSKWEFNAVTSEQLAAFSDGNHPACVQWLVRALHKKPGEGSFNGAKMSLSRYLMNAPVSDEERNKLVGTFAKNWQSSRHPTPEARAREVQGVLKFGKDNGFSCEMAVLPFLESPCHGCPVRAAKSAESAEQAGIEEATVGYLRATGKGVGVPLTNFTLKPTCKYVDASGSSHEFLAYDYKVVEAGHVNGHDSILTLDHKAWLSASEFKKQLSRKLRLRYTGTDMDLQLLRTYMTSPTMDQGVRIMKNINTVGMFHHKDIARGIDELVWVQPDWSVNAGGLENSLRYVGKTYENGSYENNLTVDMRTTESGRPAKDAPEGTPWTPPGEATIHAYRSLLKSNTPTVVGPVLGWITACWLKPHLRMRGSDRHFPVLQIYGSSGAGKTETACLFSVLGGSDYINSGPMTVSSSTPFAIREEASVSTSIPRIYDEVNEHKISDRHRYMMAVEALKASSSGGLMPQGAVDKGKSQGVLIDQRPASSPLILLATQPNNAKEIEQRAVTVSISQDKRDSDHTACFEEARDHQVHLYPVAKLLMEEALRLPKEWAWEKMSENRKALPETCKDRVGKNWQVALTGIDFLVASLTKALYPNDVVRLTLRLKDAILELLKDATDPVNKRGETQQEVDVIIDRFGEMANYTDPNGSKRLQYGLHYSVQGTTLHIFCGVAFPMYIRYMKEMGKMPELSELRQFKSLLSSQPYFLGDSLAPGVTVPGDWYSFSLPELEDRGISVQRFTAV